MFKAAVPSLAGPVLVCASKPWEVGGLLSLFLKLHMHFASLRVMEMETPLEHVLMAFNKEGMIAYMESHPGDFGEAVKLATGDKQPYSWRAAWLLWSVLQQDDPRIKPYIRVILDCIPGKKDGHQRELIKMLGLMELDEAHEGVFFNLCMNLWEKTHAAPSVRHTALKVIIRIAKKYPELFNDVRLVTQDHYLESLSPGVRSSVYRMVDALGQ